MSRARVIADAAYFLGAIAIVISQVADYGWIRVVGTILGLVALSTLWVQKNGKPHNHEEPS